MAGADQAPQAAPPWLPSGEVGVAEVVGPGNPANRPIPMTGTGRGAGARAGGVPAGDPEAAGAAPGPPPRPRKSLMCRPCREPVSGVSSSFVS